jgi:hypothetical protein
VDWVGALKCFQNTIDIKGIMIIRNHASS